jgi:hypothetical protein
MSHRAMIGRGRRRRWATAVFVAGAMALGGPAVAGAQPADPAPPPVVSGPSGTAPPAATGRGPAFTGRTEPTALQRVTDTLIWVWLLVVLLGAPAVWVWANRRRRASGPADGGHR